MVIVRVRRYGLLRRVNSRLRSRGGVSCGLMSRAEGTIARVL